VPDAAWVAMGMLRHVGGKTLRALLAHFQGDIYAILAADVKTLRQVPGVGAKIARAITEIDLEQVQQSIECWQKQDIHVVTWRERNFPRRLAFFEDAPPLLFFRGAMPPSAEFKAVAIIGTRQPTRESVQLAQALAADFVSRGCVIVSGLALGIDTAAHQGALATQDGQTLAVLGGGMLDNIYPPENNGLAQAVMLRGALVCEVDPQAVVSSPGLVARNRIITGLCDSVIVVETQVDGGAMHAARFAKLQRKTLYAVDNNASGNRMLLQNGALPVPSQYSDLDWFHPPD
jgi:DNA processing protein